MVAVCYDAGHDRGHDVHMGRLAGVARGAGVHAHLGRAHERGHGGDDANTRQEAGRQAR